MHRIDDRIVLSPSDLVAYLACEHVTQLELAAARGERTRPRREDPELDLLARRGEAHERAHLERLRQSYPQVVEIGQHDETLAGLGVAEAETVAAMRKGADVIYQASFFDGVWRGRADFLLRVESPSDLGAWSYEVADTKLARSVKVAALLQMCEYSRQVERLQGRAPRRMHVVLGDGSAEAFTVAEFGAYHRGTRRRLEDAVLGAPRATYPDPVEHCRVCRWNDVCKNQRRRDDHLSLVAGMRRDHTRRLVRSGIATVAELAVAPEAPAADVGAAAWARLRQQARLQVEERVTHRQTFELLPTAQPGLGLAALPPPSPGDLFFDMEGDPYVTDAGLEYLFGITEVVGRTPRFHPFWAHDRAQEKIAFEALVDFVVERLDRDPTLHVYHYSSYEPAALKTLMSRHATREEEVDRLLRGGVLVDLYRAVTQGIRVSKDSYSLKSLEAYYMPHREEAIADAASSIVAYERWLETRDRGLLEAIAAYNERDCESTRRLRDWLEERRTELAAQTGRPIPRPDPRDGAPSEQLAQMSAEIRELVEGLTDGVPDQPDARRGEEQAQWLLAQLLDWHRREDKASWWAYFGRREMSDEELVDDSEAIGSLTHLGAVHQEKKSTVHRYVFDPSQEHKLDVGDSPHDPRDAKPMRACGEIVGIDQDNGTIELKRGPSFAGREHPTALIPPSPISTTPVRVALRRVAQSVLAHGIDGPGSYRAVRDLLLRHRPRLRGRGDDVALVEGRDGDEVVEATCALVAALDDSYLAIQGPPGCGKTYTGARIVVDLVLQGRRVGVSATSHRAIGRLLEEICTVSRARGQPVRIVQKCTEQQACGASDVRRVATNAEVVAALSAGEADVVAGTQWLFAADALDRGLDVVVIDEAGQMSLANVCAVGTAARNLVLLGDPQQLAQPSQGVHPEGAERSALDHVLAGHDTIPPDRGVFLPATRRMHPAVCAFVSDAFYDGRLSSHPSCSRQQLDAGAELGGAGICWAAVEHSDNRTSSQEEAVAIRQLVQRLGEATWTDADGVVRQVRWSDILVVAPYNAQVKRLRSTLPGGIPVGTVDRFQGQQAAVAIYSLATSSAEHMPRTLEFLYSRNRLNVAVSRAHALAIVVCSPALLRAACRTPGQLRLVSALCRYAEMARPLATADAVLQGPAPLL
jgi:predicted RecB family nuclease